MPSSIEDIPVVRYDLDCKLGLREPGISRLNPIPIEECGEDLVHLPSVVGRRAIIKARLPWVRETVAGMIVTALGLLPPDLTLKISTCFRTIKMQKSGYDHYMRELTRKHPGWPRSVLVRETNKFFHPVTTPAPPGHCTGAAVDVGLCHRSNGRMLDVVSTTRDVKNSWPTFLPDLTVTARRNRAALYEVMSEAGFSNCYDEWWHWSYGDSGWAGRLGQPQAIYGLVTSYPEALAKEIKRKPPKPRPRRTRPRLDKSR